MKLSELYEKTHQRFSVPLDWDRETETWPAVALCREYLGDNDPYELLQNRKWFTFPGNEVWIRRDCLDSIPATWFGLQNKHER